MLGAAFELSDLSGLSVGVGIEGFLNVVEEVKLQVQNVLSVPEGKVNCFFVFFPENVPSEGHSHSCICT